MTGDPAYWEWLADGPAELRDCRRRLWWAERDGEALSRAIHSFTKPADGNSPHSVYVSFDAGRYQATFCRMIPEREEWEAFEHFARLIGSWLDHSRAALNYLACNLAELAIREDPSLADESLPFEQRLRPEGLEFPIFEKAAKYKHRNTVRKLPKKYLDEMEVVQPCFGGDAALWDLQVLAAEYRHRVIHPVAVMPLTQHFGATFDGEPIDGELEICAPTGVLEDGTPLMRFTVRDVPAGRERDVKPVIALSIGLDHHLCAGRDCISVVNAVNRAVISVVQRFEPFFTPGS